MPLGRRQFLISSAAVTLAGCSRASARPAVPTRAPLPADFDRWTKEAHGILSDGLETLRTFDGFQAFRLSNAPQSSPRPGAGLAWDPPTSAAWDEATHVTRGFHGRAEQLFQAVTTTKIDASLWREQRTVADATHDLLDLGDRLGAYRNRLDVLPPGDAADALGLLDQAWLQWVATAARWGIERAESISCASSAG